jgi:DnaJ-class molecular chaperone
MTLTEARKLLAGPLVFGNPEQVKAVELIRAAEEIRDDLEAEKTEICDVCNGTGQCECDNCSDMHDCKECYGQGVEEASESLLYKISNHAEAFDAAVKMLREKTKKVG